MGHCMVWFHLQPVVFHVQLQRVGWRMRSEEVRKKADLMNQLAACENAKEKPQPDVDSGYKSSSTLLIHHPQKHPHPSQNMLCIVFKQQIHIPIKFSKDVFPMSGLCISGNRHIYGLLIECFPCAFYYGFSHMMVTDLVSHSVWVSEKREMGEKKAVLTVRCRIFIMSISVFLVFTLI